MAEPVRAHAGAGLSMLLSDGEEVDMMSDGRGYNDRTANHRTPLHVQNHDSRFLAAYRSAVGATNLCLPNQRE
jgi:hypothetical protein